MIGLLWLPRLVLDEQTCLGPPQITDKKIRRTPERMAAEGMLVSINPDAIRGI